MMRTYTNGSRVTTAIAMLSAAALALLAGCGDGGGSDDAEAAGATIGDLQQWCDVVAEVDARFATLDAGEQSFAVKQRGYAEVGRLLDQVDASAGDVVDASAIAGVRQLLDFATVVTEAFVVAESEEAAVEAVFESEDSPFATGAEPDGSGAAWVLDHCGIDIDGDDDAAASASAAPATVTVVAGDPIPVVVDYSPTSSDVTALLYLAEHPGVDLRAVTLAGTGESRCEAAIPNTVALLALAGRPDVPVACGRTEPIGAGNEWPSEWRDAADELAGLTLTAGAAAPSRPGDAADLLADTIAGAGGEAVVVALGPLTNIAEAVQRHPALVDEVSMLYTMGGAIDVAGNAPNGTAEWNFYVDPTAVDVVVRSGMPVTLVPLDATNDVPVTEQWFVALEGDHSAPSADAVFRLFGTGRPWETGFSFWDELTAAIAIDDSLATFADATIRVSTEGSGTGTTLVDDLGTRVRVATDPDRGRFEATLLTVLAGDA